MKTHRVTGGEDGVHPNLRLGRFACSRGIYDMMGTGTDDQVCDSPRFLHECCLAWQPAVKIDLTRR